MKLPATIVPEYDTAVSQFESMGGHLTHVSQFGIDPLARQGHFIDQRYHNFQQTFPDFAPIFHALCNNNCDPFRECIRLYIQLTEHFMTQN